MVPAWAVLSEWHLLSEMRDTSFNRQKGNFNTEKKREPQRATENENIALRAKRFQQSITEFYTEPTQTSKSAPFSVAPRGPRSASVLKKPARRSARTNPKPLP